MPETNHSAVFLLHVMKTAGTSVTRALRSRFSDRDLYPRPDASNTDAQRFALKCQVAQLTAATEHAGLPMFVSVHMPGWVADRAADSHLRVTVLRNPVERTISHLRHIARNSDRATLDDIYDDPIYRKLLPNYQTRVFAATEAYYLQREREITEAFTRAITGEPEPPNMPARSAEMERAALRLSLHLTEPLDPGSLDRARARLSTFDVVGLTEQLDQFADAIEEHTGARLDLADRANRATDNYAISASLRHAIEEDNRLDLELYSGLSS